MGRPREYEKRITTNIRLPPDLHQRLQDAADEREVSVNLLMIHAAEQFLDRLLPIEQVLGTSAHQERPDG